MGAKVEWFDEKITVSRPEEGKTAIRNVYNWRVKETERMKAIVTELRKLGATVEEGHDYCVIEPPAKLNEASIDTYDDHRMAMAFSLAACGSVPVVINDPKCTAKTFPTYFDELQKLIQGSKNPVHLFFQSGFCPDRVALPFFPSFEQTNR
ncbi:hypothetical protein NDN08_006545 [Rhodosorus marinus]|uniref:3-phosphoshikimate 1-carboxyvinyltransferase n=1 Tax=Rhodosorus marinus TaxID=101924 RepID=A0AAV8ULV6_9RHOD|nr:hypothetical protein NDN08_006545 [Rhodosorus marinus]